MTSIRPVILSGGSGSRLWPLSNSDRPKQFLSLVGSQTLFAATVQRASVLSSLPPTVVTGPGHVDLVEDESPPGSLVLVEPVPRNTAPAIVAAALASDPGDILVVLPSDHLVSDTGAFVDSVQVAATIARGGGIVTLGVVPTRPETGYGWIWRGAAKGTGGFVIREFVEKPDEQTAAALLAGGEHLWNSGVFVASAGQILSEVEALCPELLAAVTGAMPARRVSPVILDEAFSNSPSISFDKAIMERLTDGSVVPLDAGWSDVGSWLSVWENVERDDSGNATAGEVIAVDSKNSLVWSSRRPVAVVGLEGVVVVETDDGILVADMGRGQDIRSVVEGLGMRTRAGE